MDTLITEGQLGRGTRFIREREGNFVEYIYLCSHPLDDRFAIAIVKNTLDPEKILKEEIFNGHCFTNYTEEKMDGVSIVSPSDRTDADGISNESRIMDFISNKIPALSKDGADSFYLIHIIQRRKDIPNLDRSDRVIKTYTITSIECFKRILPEIKAMCKMFNARAYMYINRRSFKGVAKAMLKKITDSIVDGTPTELSRLYQSCASAHSSGDGYWILDVDLKHKDGFDEVSHQETQMAIYLIGKSIAEFLNGGGVQPTGHKTEMFLSTKNGFHIVTTKFDTKNMRKIVDIVKCESESLPYDVDIELKKDSMVNLYIP